LGQNHGGHHQGRLPKPDGGRIMILGVMQPYLFPYIGYFQLINAVDVFVLYDDVNYIRQGWINRNRLLVNGVPYMFTVPVEDTSSFRKIKDVKISQKAYSKWRKKFFQTVKFNYSKAPHYNDGCILLDNCLSSSPTFLIDIVVPSILMCVDYLKITTSIRQSSTIYDNDYLHKEKRLYDICRKESARTYINAVGGQEIYDKQEFLNNGVVLNFMKSNLSHYDQNTNKSFVSGLSILDVIMFNTPKKINSMLGEYQLI
jgi:hypothetical protein